MTDKTMKKTVISNLGLVSTFGFLAACGGGGTSVGGGIDPDPDVPPPITLQSAVGTQQVTVIAADGTSVSVTLSSSTIAQLDRIGATEQTYGAILSDGRIVGLETLSGNVPTSGTFTYNGTAIAVINDGTHFYDLVGSSRATLDLGNQTSDLDVTLDGFSGDRTAVADGNTTSGVFPGISVTWQNANICNSTQFCNGSANVLGTAATLSQNATSDAGAALFGPSAEEIGGVIDIVDPGILEATAGFTAAQ
jgi:hypothetical protein